MKEPSVPGVPLTVTLVVYFVAPSPRPSAVSEKANGWFPFELSDISKV